MVSNSNPQSGSLKVSSVVSHFVFLFAFKMNFNRRFLSIFFLRVDQSHEEFELPLSFNVSVREEKSQHDLSASEPQIVTGTQTADDYTESGF